MTRPLSEHARAQVEGVAQMLAADVEGPAIRAALANLVTENGNGTEPASAPARRLDLAHRLDCARTERITLCGRCLRDRGAAWRWTWRIVGRELPDARKAA